MSCKSKSSCRKTLMDLYNEMIEQKDYVYNKQDCKSQIINNFDEIDIDKLEKIFDSNGKPYFFSNKLR